MRIISLDIGGTSIKHAVVDSNGALTDKTQTPSEAKKPGGVLRAVFNIIDNRLLAEPADGIAIATAGLVDDAGKVVFAGDNFTDYSGTDLKKIVEQKFSLPTVVENDANAAAVGEYYYGAGRNSSSVFMITVGTGVGGAFIDNGKIMRGASCSAGEIGFIPVGENLKLEDLASGSAMVKKIAAAKNLSPEDVDGKQIWSWVNAKDLATLEALISMARALAKGTATVCCLLNPQTIVFGGGAIKSSDFVGSYIIAELNKLLPPPLRQNTAVKFAELGNDAGLVGAAALFAKRFG